MTITMAVFYIVMQNDWKRLAVCLAGFMTVKFVMTRMIRNSAVSISGKERMN
jgi:hypothetical protein